jgi:hypothetical protein
MLVVGVYEYMYRKGMERITVVDSMNYEHQLIEMVGVKVKDAPLPYYDYDAKLHIFNDIVLDSNIIQTGVSAWHP